MRVYIIGSDGITLCREPPAAVNEGEIVVASISCRRSCQSSSIVRGTILSASPLRWRPRSSRKHHRWRDRASLMRAMPMSESGQSETNLLLSPGRQSSG